MIRLPKSIYDALCAHAVETFPHECCGLVVARADTLEAVRVTNIQNQKHAENPEHFPRTAEIAYTMGPEAAPILVAHDRGSLSIRAFYHSHPQHASYFSEEDKKQAMVWDEPSYPDAMQIVISVYDREVKDTKAFQWNEPRRDFVEVGLALIDD
jgi:proteasome lid subunit RPN8/RPN11